MYEKVLAYNEETGEVGYYPVVAIWAHEDPVIVTLTIEGETIETTPEHPFYTDEGEWLPAASLQAGDEIRTSDWGTGTVEAIQFSHQPQLMYNFTVATAHTYFVGQGEWLVHNSCIKFPDFRQVQAKFKHAWQFGVSGNWNASNGEKFQDVLTNFVYSDDTVKMSGTYRWAQEGYHYFDPTNGLWVFTDLDGNFVTGWQLDPQQLYDLITQGNVY